MMLLILQNNCDEFWSWSWAYPIIGAFILGILLGWLFSSIFKEKDESCKCCDGVKAELEACRSNINILTSREVRSFDLQKEEAAKKALEEKSISKAKTAKKKTTKIVAEKKTKSETKVKATKTTIVKKNPAKKTVKKTPAKKAVKKDSVKKTVKTPAKKTEKKTPVKTKTAVVKSDKKDNLTKVEGIGPKIQELFNNDGIDTWKKLAETKVERLQEILDLAGPRYRIHNPASWPLQADMCAKGKWEELKKWQDEHKGGRL